jgi:hypothetical protein
MIAYTWKIEALSCIPLLGEIENYISEVHWRYVGQQDLKTAEQYGVEYFQMKDRKAVIPFAEITEEMVISWLEGSLDVFAMQQAIETELNLVPNNIFINPFKNEDQQSGVEPNQEV